MPSEKPTEQSSDFEDNSHPIVLHYLEPQNKNEIPMFLALCHVIAALFQCVQAIFLLTFSSQTNLRWNIYTNFPVVDEEMRLSSYDEDGMIYYVRPQASFVGGYYVTWMTCGFVLLSGFDHLLCVLPKSRECYEYYLARNQSPFRWAEYSLSAPLMKMHIAQVAGVTDAHILFLIFFLNHVAIYFPLLHEIMNAKARADGYSQNWFPLLFGIIPYIACWLVIFCYFFETLSREEQPPGFVYSIVFSLFFVEMLFPVCFIMQWKKIWKFDDYLIGEFGFIMLSFIAKSILAWATLIGATAYVDNYKQKEL
jgi:hypothetical protein